MGDIIKKETLELDTPREIKALGILTRFDGDLDQPVKFHTFTPEKIEKLTEMMPEIHRACRSFGRKNTQVTNKLMTLNMVCNSPYRQLRQCVAQIERKTQALKENHFKYRENEIHQAEIQEALRDRELDKFARARLENELVKLVSDMADGAVYFEGALKELGSFQQAYTEIIENNNIPKDWDENDVEEAEIQEHVRQVFILGLRDMVMTSRLNVGTLEYAGQFGIPAHRLFKEISAYMDLTNKADADIEFEYKWLDNMVEKYGQEYKKVMKRMGITTLSDLEWCYKSNG